jgi:hypothetical protein
LLKPHVLCDLLPPVRRAPLIAFKALAAASSPTAASGAYTYWQDLYALSVGTQTSAPNSTTFTSLQDCKNACDADAACAGFTILNTLDVNDRWPTCGLVTGVEDYGAVSFTRADAGKLEMPVLT